MTNTPTDALPTELAEVVQTALGDGAIADVRLFKGGLSGAALYFFTHGDRPYVVRRGHPDRVAREFACMRIASERGIAPKLFHTDESRGVAVMAYVAGDRHPRGPEHTARVARALRSLHEGPAFAFESTPLETLRWVDGMIREASGDGLSERIVAPVTDIATAMQAYATSAPCHADLNPSNLLDDGDRIYLIDWEAAGMGDPYVDLAQLGVFYFPTPAMREALLEAYLGRPATPFQQARSTLARVIALGMYAAAFTLLQTVTTGSPRLSDEPLSIPELLALLGSQPATMPTGIIAASLLAEMEREYAANAVRAAKETVRSV